MTNKTVCKASVVDLRQSMEIAQNLMRTGVAFICVPYFNDEQKVIAAALVDKNIDTAMEHKT